MRRRSTALDSLSVLDKLITSYSSYYDINRGEDPLFAARAVFHSHNEQFFLSKAAKLSEAETHEYVFFAHVDTLDVPLLKKLDSEAWEQGLRGVAPSSSHQSSDVILEIIAKNVTDEALELIPKLKHSKNYKFGLHGISRYRLYVLDCSSGSGIYNYQGRLLNKMFDSIVSHEIKNQKNTGSSL